MYKRVVEDACANGVLTNETLTTFTDEGLLAYLTEHAPSSLLTRLRTRQLYKRVAQWPASELSDGFGEWIGSDQVRTRATERALAAALNLAEDDVLLDYPEKTQMLGLDIPVLRRTGEIEQLTGQGIVGIINLPRLSQELYSSARWLRVFTARPVEADRQEILGIIRAA
jgi:hypothetical protein